MDTNKHKLFKQRMLLLKEYKLNNPDKGYWDWRNGLPSFEEGGIKGYYSNHTGTPTMYVPVTKEYEMNPENQGQIANVHTPEVVITPRDNLNVEGIVDRGRRSAFEAIKEAANYTPVIGDVMDVSDAVYQATQGDYSKAVFLGGLALLPNVLEKPFRKIINKYGKKGLVRSIYNNVAPGSYYNSYIPNGTKRDEIKNAVKDYLLGKGDKIDPKWEDWFRNEGTLNHVISVESNRELVLNIMTEARKEAWLNYLGIPHEDKYLINTGVVENGLPVYRSNITAIPETQLLSIAEGTVYKDNVISYVDRDFINSTGGNISVRYEDANDLRKIAMEDVWDLNPFLDANNARILPKRIILKYTHPEVFKNGKIKLVWNDNAPKWLINLEPSKILGVPGPFLNRTSFNARKLNKHQTIKKIPLSKQEFVDRGLDYEYEHAWIEEMSDKELMKWKQDVRNKYSNYYDNLTKTDPYNDILFKIKEISHEKLLKRYGAYVPPYTFR